VSQGLGTRSGWAAQWQRALITGASAGIGEAFAEALANNGTDLVLVARRRARLEQLATDLQARHEIAVEALAADLTAAEDLGRVEARLEDGERPIDLLVNNAGSETEHAPFLDRHRDLLDAEAHLNALALLRLTHAAATAMARRGHGNIVNVSAGVAFYPTPGSAAYAASKAFVNSLSVALDYELRPHGVRVTAACPGFTPTEAQARLGLHAEWVPRAFRTEPAYVAAASLRAATKGRRISSLTRAGALVSFLGHHLPRPLWLPGVARAQARLAGPSSSGASA
jgi:short-subunit dehydrogenase